MKLALYGGKKLRTEPFPNQPTPNGQILSGYRGNYTQAFWGGNHVKEVEKKFPKIINGKKNKEIEQYRALAINSCTSALIVACGAVGIKPGDEVIVTPWSMSCSATAPMFWGGIPVFADIDKNNFCLDPKSIKEKITNKTKAIIIVDLFGQAPDVEAIQKIAKKHNLYVIEDAAQAIGGYYKDKPNGTHFDIGCYSFTQGKHLTCGEGGMMMIKDNDLYLKCALLRNHAESVVNDMVNVAGIKYVKEKGLDKMYGLNLRMTEMQAIVLDKELDGLETKVKDRNKRKSSLTESITQIPFIEDYTVSEKNEHSYYVMPLKYKYEEAPVSRNKFIEAVKAELTGEFLRIDRGVPIGSGYIKPLYQFPLFDYPKEKWLPTVERLQDNELFLTLYHGLDLSNEDIDSIAGAFHKVYENIDEIIEMEGK